ncbi:hypothetical protein C7S15_5156 [Burkholderia cepacia]|nr:hypothetical protein [Burkholderia cepacia]
MSIASGNHAVILIIKGRLTSTAGTKEVTYSIAEHASSPARENIRAASREEAIL